MTRTETTAENAGHTRPDVAAFVADVRSRLGDLSGEQRDDLLEGLEADLGEQLADGTTGVLADPAAYAAELRAAAGLEPARRRSLLAAPDGDWVGRDLDRLNGWWTGRTDASRWSREAWSMLVAVRPAWWVLRGWVAATLLDTVLGPYEVVTPVPTLGRAPVGAVVLLAAIVGSVLVGQGRLWLGGRSGTGARVVLLLLNVVAVLVPLGFNLQAQENWQAVDLGYANGYGAARSEHPTDGLRLGGRAVSNVFAYDASGLPIDGVQLVDQDGRPLAVPPRRTVTGSGASRTVGCPWFNGATPLFNVYPLSQRTQRHLGCLTEASSATGDVGPSGVPTPPLAQVPPVTRTP